MAKFEFKNNNVELEINGQIFSVELTNEVLLSCDSIGEKARAILKKLDKNEDEKNVLVQACDVMVEGIEGIIGEGSVSKVFGEKAITLFDLTDILIFIRVEVAAALQKKLAEYGIKK